MRRYQFGRSVDTCQWIFFATCLCFKYSPSVLWLQWLKLRPAQLFPSPLSTLRCSWSLHLLGIYANTANYSFFSFELSCRVVLTISNYWISTNNDCWPINQCVVIQQTKQTGIKPKQLNKKVVVFPRFSEWRHKLFLRNRQRSHIFVHLKSNHGISKKNSETWIRSSSSSSFPFSLIQVILQQVFSLWRYTRKCSSVWLRALGKHSISFLLSNSFRDGKTLKLNEADRCNSHSFRLN